MRKLSFMSILLVSSFGFAIDDRMVGDWISVDANEVSTLMIEADGNFYHSRYGRGDVEHKNASRYEINVYHSDDTGGASDKCTAIIDFSKDEMFVNVRPNTKIGNRCDWGHMKKLMKESGTKTNVVPDPKSVGGNK